MQPATPLSEQIDWYLEFLAARPASRGTIATYRSGLAHLERFAIGRGCLSAEDWTADLLRSASVAVMAEGARALANADLRPTRSKGNEGMARIMVTAARGMSTALRNKRGLQVVDLRSVEGPHVPERLQPRVRLKDFLRLQDALDRRRAYTRYSRFLVARDSALVQFLYETALRAIEVSRLDIADIELEGGAVAILEGKGRKPRRLGILDPDSDPSDGGETVQRLREYLAERAKRPGAARQRALWIGVRGRRLSPNSLRQILLTLCQEAGLSGNLPVHAFRRGWFTAAYQAAPQDLPILVARMGWGKHSEQMVDVYTRGALLDFASQPRPLVSQMGRR